MPHDELLAGTGERNVYQLVPEKVPKKNAKQRNSRLVLRFKEASQDDVEVSASNFAPALRGC